jgi:DNA-binding transcriptional MerR regulator/glycosidase
MGGTGSATVVGSQHRSDAALHPIRVVARRSGLKPDLIRAWERRYGAVQPGRDADNERAYTEADIQRLILLRKAVDGGRRIGAIARLSTEALAGLVAEDIDGATGGDAVESALAAGLECIRSMDLPGLLAILDELVESHGWEAGLVHGVVPLLLAVEDDRRDGRLHAAHASVAEMAVRALLLPRVARTSGGADIVPSILVLEQQTGSISGLLVAACAASHGFRPTVVGGASGPAETSDAAAAIDALVVAVADGDSADPGGRRNDSAEGASRPTVFVASGLREEAGRRSSVGLDELGEVLDVLRTSMVEAGHPHAHPHRDDDPFMTMDRPVPLCLHICRDVRAHEGASLLGQGTGTVDLSVPAQVAEVARRLELRVRNMGGGSGFGAGALMAAAHLHDFGHRMLIRTCRTAGADVVREAAARVAAAIGPSRLDGVLRRFATRFDLPVGETDPTRALKTGVRAVLLEEMLILRLLARNPGLRPMAPLFALEVGRREDPTSEVLDLFEGFIDCAAAVGAGGRSAMEVLRLPVVEGDGNLVAQMETMLRLEGELAGHVAAQILRTVDALREEIRPPFIAGARPKEEQRLEIPVDGPDRFTPDGAWMPGLVLVAKHTLVWLRQLERRFGRPVRHLDAIPDQALTELADLGVNGLWLVGVWERSEASAAIKAMCGREAPTASAYSIREYEVAAGLGGPSAARRLAERAAEFGIRLGCDVVANHTGIDARWVVDHPNRFVSTSECPYPAYSFTGRNLVASDRVSVRLADQYLDQSDAPVVFRREDLTTSEVRYLYHGNDGTGLPWNDTAQLDYTREETRRAMVEVIVDIAKRFPILRLDAAMALARRHVQRLWYPRAGTGGAIPSRSRFGLSDAEFNALMPREFWREVVCSVRDAAPETMLIAEAFWMMEGVFAREIGLNRVYNSAFMHHLRDEDNDRFRTLVTAVLEADPRFLEHGLNYLSTPDEASAARQFGTGAKYRAAALLLATFPGTPLIAHGQFEGYEEQYGMEYDRPMTDEGESLELLEFHRSLAPLLGQRARFSGSVGFRLLRAVDDAGCVEGDVITYLTGDPSEPPVLVVVNNGSERIRCAVDRVVAPVSGQARDLAAIAGRAEPSVLFRTGTADLRWDGGAVVADLGPYGGSAVELTPATGA